MLGDSTFSPAVPASAAQLQHRQEPVPLQTRACLAPCQSDTPLGGFQVQAIPWVLADSSFVRSPCRRLDPSRTVFVGALHGMLNAEALAAILNDLFGGVVYAGIDTDKHKYPIGECPTSMWESWGPQEVAQDCDTSPWEWREA